MTELQTLSLYVTLTILILLFSELIAYVWILKRRVKAWKLYSDAMDQYVDTKDPEIRG